MIRLATQEDRTTIERLCAKEPWDGTEVMTAYLSRCADTAQVDWQYSDLWVGQSQTQKQNAQYLLCRIGQTYRIVGSPRSKERWEELHHFLQMQPAGKLAGSAKLIDGYDLRFGQLPAVSHPSGPRMICQRLPDDVSESSVCSCEGLGEVYDLLAQADPSFAKRHTKDDYLARLLFLKRGGGQFFKLCLQGRAAAVGGILLPEGCDYGLILNLCTLPEFRGQGLGGQLVSRLCLEAFWQGKTPLLDCADQQLENFYQKLGFVTTSEWKSRQRLRLQLQT